MLRRIKRPYHVPSEDEERRRAGRGGFSECMDAPRNSSAQGVRKRVCFFYFSFSLCYASSFQKESLPTYSVQCIMLSLLQIFLATEAFAVL